MDEPKLTGRAREIADSVAAQRQQGDFSQQIDAIFTDWLWHDFLLLEREVTRLQEELQSTRR